jgi:hypothetical protein
MNLPNPQPVLDLIEAFRHSKTMFAAVSEGGALLIGGKLLEEDGVGRASVRWKPSALVRL